MALCGIKGASELVGEIIIQRVLSRNEGRGAVHVRVYHSLYINPYLIRLSPACLLCHGMWREGRAWGEGSKVDMRLLLISTGGRATGRESLARAPGTQLQFTSLVAYCNPNSKPSVLKQ